MLNYSAYKNYKKEYMIPQKIQIKNFLSYGPNLQTIDFTHHSLICLSGKNGHGKSALLDAMTWAIWGQARKVSGATKADQGLLRLGQTQMLVVFDFLFGGKQYRIRREYMETYGKPVNILEFGMLESESDTLIPLTDKTIRTTQEKIEQTLRLDFDSFSNSAFLRQGSSNEFSKKSPKDRKQILATILGLDQYEVIRKLATEKVKDAFNKKTVLMALQEKRSQELTTQETLNAELERITTEMKDLAHTEQTLHNQHKNIAQQRTAYDEQCKEYHNISFQLQQLTEHTHTQKKQLLELVTQWRHVNQKKQSLANMQQLQQQKNNIISAIAHHQKLLQENLEQRHTLLTITQQLTAIEQQHKDELTKQSHTLQLELERLRAEHKNLQTVAHNHKQQLAQLQKDETMYATHIQAHQQELSNIKCNSTDITCAEAHLENRKATYQHFVSLGNWMSNELNSLVNKKKLVHDENDPSCPLCEQNLSASRRRFLKLNFEKQESFLAHRLRRLKRIIPIIKETLIAQHAIITQDKTQLNYAAQLTAKMADSTTLRAKIIEQIAQLTTASAQTDAEITQYAHSITIKEKEITQHQNTTLLRHPSTSSGRTDGEQANPQYHELLQHKQQLEQQLQQHQYKEEHYKKDQELLAHIELQLADHHTVQKDIAQQEMRKNSVNNLCEELKTIKQHMHCAEKKRTALGDLATQLRTLQEQETKLESHKIELKNKKESLLHAKGSIENQHKHLQKIKQEFEQEQVNIAQLNSIIDDYQTIATATGKDGIQALLIEEAIPEIEQEANVLLSRLTNNQAQIFIDSLRDLKKGGTKETLDIKISDQAGIRPYELFSGGEAFRIDFALRIAISKLLARRAGTALQTLIIDEGFGSQDDEGLGHIMDALHKIQDDFSKIIIVSHLPTMKDQFPVQFYIEKGVQGSTVTVLEQG
jgi:DNA repair protein SbcC/Rad50